MDDGRFNSGKNKNSPVTSFVYMLNICYSTVMKDIFSHFCINLDPL